MLTYNYYRSCVNYITKSGIVHPVQKEKQAGHFERISLPWYVRSY